MSAPGAGASLARRIALLAITGVSLYLVAPTLVEVFSEVPRLAAIEPGWFVVMVGFQGASVACICALQRIAFRARRWFAVVTSYLAGSAFGRVVPGGGAAAATLQYAMLVRSGMPSARIASGLTASSLLTAAALLVLPVLALPFVLLGSATISDRLTSALLLGAALFVVLSAIAAALLISEPLLRRTGRGVQRLRNRLQRRRPPRDDLPELLARERRAILRVLGDRWWEAVLLTVGRWLLDLFTLMAALAAVGARPTLIPVLIAYCAAQILAQVPITPGGIGFVEAGLTATLALAGVGAADAVLATLAYRLVSFWLPLPVGAVAAILHQRRYGERRDAPDPASRGTAAGP